MVQCIAKEGNELFRRKSKGKATKKEKTILKELRQAVGSENVPNTKLLDAKEKWLDKLRQEQVLMEKIVILDRRRRNNILSERGRKIIQMNELYKHSYW